MKIEIHQQTNYPVSASELVAGRVYAQKAYDGEPDNCWIATDKGFLVRLNDGYQIQQSATHHFREISAKVVIE